MSTVIVRGPEQIAYAIKVISALDPKKFWQIEIKRYSRRRTLQQNALLHKHFQIIADEIGDDLESVKRDLKRMYAPLIERVSKITGEIVMEPMDTHEMSTLELTEFMQRVMSFAGSQLGIMLPLPEDQHRDNMP